jgi:flagellar biogenesis protein FliO
MSQPSSAIFPLEVPARKPRRHKQKPVQKHIGLLRKLRRTFAKAVAWLQARKLSIPERKLRLCESISLGEKRFAAVLEYEGQRFLVGGGSQSVQLLTTIRAARSPKTVLSNHSNAPEAQ